MKQADLVIFCTAADVMIRFLAENKAFFTPGTILTDVAGIKGDTATAIAALLPEGVDFVPGHPMAGREGRGYAMLVPISSTAPITSSSPWKAMTKTISWL